MRFMLCVVLGFFLIASLAEAACGLPSTVGTTTTRAVPSPPTEANFQLCINDALAANTGTQVITVPAGTINVTTGLLVNLVGKSMKLTIVGQTVVAPHGTSATDNTVLVDNGSAGYAMQVNGTSAVNFADISGLTFTKSAVHPFGAFQVSGTNFQVAFRFHHNHITGTDVNGGRGIQTTSVYGLIDNSRIDMMFTCVPVPPSHKCGPSVQSISIGGTSGGSDGGFSAWKLPLSMGTDKAVYVEDNTITYTVNNTGTEDSLDAYSGARIVVRHNFINNIAMGLHGTDSGPYRSPVSLEVYNNVFTNNSLTSIRAFTVRGGTGVFFNNTYTGTGAAWSGITLIYYRACNIGLVLWGQKCDGTNWELGSADPNSNRSRLCSARNGGTTGVTTNSTGYPVGATSVTLAATGSGTIAPGDYIYFGTSGVTHTVTSVTGGGGPGSTITFSQPIQATGEGAIPPTPTAVTDGGFKFNAAPIGPVPANESLGAEDGTTFTRYFDHRGAPDDGTSHGYPCRDQPGIGPGQVTEPIYAWNNGGILAAGWNFGLPENCQGFGIDQYIREDRDYVNGSPRPLYAAYVYPHPLQGGAADTTAPAAPTNITITKLERR